METNGMYKPDDPKPSEKMAREAMENLEKLTPWDSSKPKVSKPVSEPTPNAVPYRTAGTSPAEKEAKEAISRLKGLAPWDKTVAEKPAVQEGVAQSQTKKSVETAASKTSTVKSPADTGLHNKALDGIIFKLRNGEDVSSMFMNLMDDFKHRMEETMLRGEVPSKADQMTLARLLEAESYRYWKSGADAAKEVGQEVQPYTGKVVNPYENFKGYDRDFFIRYMELSHLTHEEAEKLSDMLIETDPRYKKLVETGRGDDVQVDNQQVAKNREKVFKEKPFGQNQPEQSFRIEVISAVDLAKRYLGNTPEAQEAAKEDFISKLPPEQREMAQHMQDKMENWLKDNPMLLYGEKDGKPFIYDMTDREYDKYMVLNDQQKEKYIQKLFASKEAAAAPAAEDKEAVVQAHSGLNKDGATVDTEKKGQAQTVSSGQKFGLLELLKALLQAFGFIPPEQERKADMKKDVTETQQNRQDQQEQKQQSTTVDRSIAAQAKALSEANTEALVAEQQQSQEVSRGMHI